MVLVVGGGPSGLLSSYHLCKMGVDVTLLEEDSTIGENPHCGGLVSADFWGKLGVTPRHDVVLNHINGFELHIGSKSVHLLSRAPCALVISRSLFDKYLYELAKGAGSKVLLGLRAERIRAGGQGVEVKLADNSFFKEDVVVLAEGLSRLLTFQVGGRPNGKALPSFQALVRGRGFDPRVAQVFLRGEMAPYYFAYFIPISEDAGRLGVISNKADPSKVCEKIMRTLGFAQVKRYKKWGVWLHGPIKHPSARGVLLVGDAGGFTKPLTGGGVVWGGVSARIAAEAICHSSSQDLLENYLSLSRRTFWLEARAQALFRRLLLGPSSYRVLNLLFEGKGSAQNILGEIDYDFPFSRSLPPFRCLTGKELLK
jgi:digeranylgeranylglycerophospholipid reductase